MNRIQRSIWMSGVLALLFAAAATSKVSAFIIPSKPVVAVPPTGVDVEPPIVDLPPVVVPPPNTGGGTPPPEGGGTPPTQQTPEPGTLVLGLTAAGLAGWYRRKRISK